MSLINKLVVGLFGLVSTAVMADQAPKNPWLVDSPWAINHHDSYASDTSPSPGPTAANELGVPQFVGTGPINISLPMSSLYPDGRRVWWGNDVLSVYKLALVNGKLTKVASMKKTGSPLVALRTPTSGAYTLVDRDNTYFTVSGVSMLSYRDTQPGVVTSAIKQQAAFTLPTSVTSSDDAIVGLNILWDGNLAFVTRNAVVGVVSRDFKTIQSVKLGTGEDDVSNSIATDENGGIYVVSSKAMYRVQWTGKQLSTDPSTGAWRAEYNTGSAGGSAGRLGAGSGSTPTLMGTTGQRFVVITDGADVGNMVLFWRDQIPADWRAIAPGKDSRIAAEMPINFGDVNRKVTKDEQSVVVSGYGALAVSNDYSNVGAISQLGSSSPIAGSLTNGLIQLLSASPKVQPWGVQKFEWDQASRTLRSVWATLKVSCPNAIPTMSSASNRFYCVGAHNGWWTIESLDWTTGQGHFRKYVGMLPRYNSFYSQTQLNDDGSMIYGSFDGVVYLPAVKKPPMAAITTPVATITQGVLGFFRR
ncbi:MAG: hypothetical protein Q7U28_04575 [Aquabacterium sp.]|nr:hypothetical protein [Aquabacterium sp.]